MGLIAIQLAIYEDQNGSLPPDLPSFTSSLNQDLLTDPWDNPYVYEISPDGANWRLRSFGEDGIVGTDDDIVIGDDGKVDPPPAPWPSDGGGSVPDGPAGAAPDTDAPQEGSSSQ